MKLWTRGLPITLVASGLAILQTPGLVQAEDKKVSVTVSFGAGLNTAQPGNAANHHVLPRKIHVAAGGVVNFVVAGFHEIFVYKPGTQPEDLAVPEFPVPGAPPRTNLFINDLNNLYYNGIDPAGGPPPATPATTNPSNASNRVESVVFSRPGTYLVICNVTPHFRDGMWAWVVVSGRDGD